MAVLCVPSLVFAAQHVPPSIVTQPIGLAVPVGQDANFSVSASGSGTLAYQWRFNGTNIAGATDTNLVVISASSSNAGIYSVQVTNLYGTINSSNATLMVNYPPTILAPPVSQGVAVGQDATFSVSASGTAPLAYQWRFNGTDILGATDSNLVVISASSSKAGIYSIEVTNSYGTARHAAATLTVYYPPSILAQPVSQAALLGSNVAFQVTATGTTALGYQWRLNGLPLPGGTNITLTISAVQSNNIGAYNAVVTNAGGATTSQVATLSIVTPPDFLWARSLPSHSAEDFYGSSRPRHFAADAFGNVFVAGLFHNTSMDFGGAILTNSTGNADVALVFLAKYDRWGNFQWVRQAGTNADLNGSPGLRVGTDSSGNSYLAGWFAGTATFGTNALVSAGPENLFLAKYDPQGQAVWVKQIVAHPFYYDSLPMAFAVDSGGNVILSSPYSNRVDFGSVVVTNSQAFLAKYDSSGNLLWARPSLAGDAVAAGPSGSIFMTGSVLYPDFLAKYDSSGNLVWSREFHHGRAITVDAAENIYTTGDGGGYYDGLTITNVAGRPDFFVARCDSSGRGEWLRQAGSVWQQMGVGIAVDALGNVYVTSTSANRYPEPMLVFGGSVLTNVMSFVAKYDGASGNALWGKSVGGNGIGGGSALAMAFTDPQQIYIHGFFTYAASFGGFNLTNDNPAQGDDLFFVKLAGYESTEPPLITVQPQSLTNSVGDYASFGVTVSGGLPRAYQWFFNVANALPGATNSTFTVTNAQWANAGSYSVIVTNPYGSATSALATLTVYPSPPLITTQPQSLTVPVGGDATFNVIAAGEAPLAYQWFFNTTNVLPGATASTYTVTNAQLANAGSYSVTVTNAYGSATSALATLTLTPVDGGTLSRPSVNRTNRTVQFTVTGLPGFKYAVQASSNLTDWIFLSTNTSPFVFTDLNAPNFARRFYRSIYIP